MEYIVELPEDSNSVWDKYVPIVESRDGRELQVYLTEAIGSASEYNELCFRLRARHAGDNVVMYVNNGGGRIASATMIMAAMAECKAKITVKLSGMVASAATEITMYADELEVADYTQFMCHNYYHGTEGTGAQVKEYINFVDAEFARSSREVYKDFLTKEELDLIIFNDKEIWLNKEQVLERWENKKLAGRPSKDKVEL